MGGMGAVYRATDLQLECQVAVKIALQPDNENHCNRFSREVRALSECLAQLDHPTLIRYLGHGITDDLRPYLVMEWLEGHELAERIQQGPLTERETLLVGLQLCNALQAAHSSGVIHRDIKPSNIFLVDRDLARVKLLDFGLARLDKTMTLVTQVGTAMGTPSYMAPEQANTDLSVDHRADLYSLGSVLFACLTGRAPFLGNHIMAILAKLHIEEPPRVRSLRSEISAALDELIARLLSKKPAHRPDTASDVGQLLLAIRDGREPSDDSERSPTIAVSALESHYTTVALVHTGAEDDARHLSADRLQALTSTYGGEQIALGATAVMVAFPAQQDATGAASLAASFALAVHQHQRALPVVLATGRRVASQQNSIGEVLSRALALLDEVSDQMATVTVMTGHEDRPLVSEILLDEVSAKLLAGRFRTERKDTGEYILLAESRVQESLDQVNAQRAPMVGRRRELSLLQATLEECIDDEVAHLVLMTGAAGVGKSRLLFEFLRRARAEGLPFRQWLARADALRAGSPLGLLADLVLDAVGGTPGMSARERQERLRQRVRELVPASQVEHMTSFLCELTGAPLAVESRPFLDEARADPRLMNDSMRRAWEDWLQAELERGPVLCVLEDIQWSDPATVRFVEGAMRRSRSQPLMVLALARPESLELFPELWRSLNPTSLNLAPLSARASQKLATAIANRPLSPDKLKALVAHSGGNPFYLEELVRYEQLDRSEEVPESVLAMISARLGRLPTLERRVLRAGSVFGSSFSIEALAALLDLRPSVLTGPIRRLIDEALLDVNRPHQAKGDIYAFGHEYLREAAYGLLTEQDRQAAHAAAARWLEKEGERDPVRLAEHYRRADLPQEAIPWFHRAARQALEADDLPGVCDWAEHALACGASGEMRGQLCMLQAEALNWSAEHERAYHAADEAMQHLTAGTGYWAHAAQLLAWAATITGRRSSLLTATDQLLAHAGTEFDALYAISLVHCCTQLTFENESQRAERISALLMSRMQRGAMSRRVQAAWAHLRSLQALRDARYGECATWAMRSISEWEAIENRRLAMLVEANLAYALLLLGQHEHCIEIIHTCIEDSLNHRVDFIHHAMQRLLLCAFSQSGQRRETEELLDQFSRRAPIPNDGFNLFHVYTARAQLWLGALDEAERSLQNAIQSMESADDWKTCYRDTIRVRLSLAQGDRAGALVQANACADLLARLPAFEEGEALVRLTHAEALEANDLHEEAVDAIRAARAYLQRKADEIDNPEWRESFLTQVPENRQILELATRWGA